MLLTGAWLLGPPMGTDLVNALVRQRFAEQHGLLPVDLSTYGGTVQFGYSLLSQYVCTLVGTRVALGLATVVAAHLFARLLSGARRPVLAGLCAAVCLTSDLVTGRTAFALGLAGGLGALLAVRSRRHLTAGALALLAAALSPVAGLFVGLAAGACLLTGPRRAALALGVGAAVPLAVTGLLFGEGGSATIHGRDVWSGSVLALAVLAAVPRPVVRVGALLQVAGLVAALFVVPSVGHNADRLVVLLAAPLVVAFAPWRPVLVAALAVGLVVLRPPVSSTDLERVGDPAVTGAFALPVVAELHRLAPTGRVEAVPLREHSEALYLSAVAPLARGWLRQLDTLRAPLFYDDTLDAATYRTWLDDNAVQYVALADSRLDGAGVDEGRLVRAGLPYLDRVWQGGSWTLYAVRGPTPLVAGAALVRSTPAEVVVAADTPGDVLVRVRPNRWLTLSGPGCWEPAGDAVRLRVRQPGRYVLSSRLHLRSASRC